MRIIVLLVVSALSVALEAGDEQSVRDQIAGKLKEEFHFDTSTPVKPDLPKDEILVLEKFTVTKFSKWRLFEESMQKDQERLSREKFTLRDGGPFATKDLGKVRAQVGVWPGGAGYEFVKFSW